MSGWDIVKIKPILADYKFYHNYFREHEGLNGKTPAKIAGIEIEGENKWITVIQNAGRHPTLNREGSNPLT